MSFKLPELPYDPKALEPHIDARTMEIHHGKHHQAYINNLNAAIEGRDELKGKTAIELILDLEALPESIRTAVRNNGGGHVNHSLFWTVMGPRGGGRPSGSLAGAIDAAFGSFEGFQKQFSAAATTVFGSGWAWLCVGADGGLLVTKTPNQDNPVSSGAGIPILGLDVERGRLEPRRRELQGGQGGREGAGRCRLGQGPVAAPGRRPQEPGRLNESEAGSACRRADRRPAPTLPAGLARARLGSPSVAGCARVVPP